MSCNEIYDLLSDDDVSYDYIMRNSVGMTAIKLHVKSMMRKY